MEVVNERVCDSVCERERERESRCEGGRERVSVCERERAREREIEREREREGGRDVPPVASLASGGSQKTSPRAPPPPYIRGPNINPNPLLPYPQ